MGPAGGRNEEVDEIHVTDRYLVGVLAPRRRSAAPGAEEDLTSNVADNGEDGRADPQAAAVESLLPSSMGFTFSAKKDAKSFQINAKWGYYKRQKSEFLTTEKGNPKTVWYRYDVDKISNPIELKEGTMQGWIPSIEEQPDVYVQGIIRKVGGDWVVTIFLVNDQQEPTERRDESWLFQVQLSVSAPGSEAIFKKTPMLRDSDGIDGRVLDEDRSMDMLYRHVTEFAVGHGTSVHADYSADSLELAIRISTRAIPSFEVGKHVPPTATDIASLANLVLSMSKLANASQSDLQDQLEELAKAYELWIDERTRQVKAGTNGLNNYLDFAEDAVEKCRITLRRIREGISLVCTDKSAYEAFKFANRAMWEQRRHTILSESKRRGEKTSLADVDSKGDPSWYPFQIAFILLNLPSITDPHHEDRSHETESIADLLWFPTGGGKTEAYLGLTAYTLAIRRLQGEVGGRSGEAGLAVLMRYTLRLLTLQQFQRATALICACEMIRREDKNKWGSEPFRIGLWVGAKTTPNKTDRSAEAIQQVNDFRPDAGGGGGTPHQLTNCPWCGESISPGRDIIVEPYGSGRAKTIVYCGDKLGACLFSRRLSAGEGLPVVVVDEEIYRRLPSVMIATVDKFAQLPWKGATQVLFGNVSGKCERHGFVAPEIEDKGPHAKRNDLPKADLVEHQLLRPIDLIIQDELHLISGPLGTLVGLYETAIDELCSWELDGKRVRPKVIASTATIKQAEDQIHKLFLRRVSVFPPQGTDSRDNFFSIQKAPSEEVPGRLYLGICAPGRRIKNALVRVYTTVLAAAQTLYKKYGAQADPWMTMVGYFGSMSELGSARRMIDDRVRSSLRNASERGLQNRRIASYTIEELTSRKSAVDIPYILDRMEVPFEEPDDDDQPTKDDEKGKGTKEKKKSYPIDVLLATNMISVGVDVKRLGLMVVAGQPKNTAEYIQATSRVGRNKPGLVITVYNWSRPRDLSHYETFEHYHATFYKQVEALSVTPFAARALDRGLTGVLVSLIRLPEFRLNPNDKANAIQRDDALVLKAVERIVRRAELVTESIEIGDQVRQGLKRRLDYWCRQASKSGHGGVLTYEPKKDGISVPLLQRPGLEEWQIFTCLNSLRDVEPTVGLILKKFEAEEEEEQEEGEN
ncbi:MAG: DISARM system helicase DrmA [Candidatus Obscuribacterales bacterium]|nr:DISARM system helicase DrmA [Candidatus Obscuribacterales bacterium]